MQRLQASDASPSDITDVRPEAAVLSSKLLEVALSFRGPTLQHKLVVPGQVTSYLLRNQRITHNALESAAATHMECHDIRRGLQLRSHTADVNSSLHSPHLVWLKLAQQPLGACKQPAQQRKQQRMNSLQRCPKTTLCAPRQRHHDVYRGHCVQDCLKKPTDNDTHRHKAAKTLRSRPTLLCA